MGKEKDATCPCCEGSVEDFPGQDGACDYYCTHCGWREYVPGSDNIAAALTLREARKPDSQPASGPQPPTAANVDPELLEQQAAILGKIADGSHPTEEERSCLKGLWELVHTMLDGRQADKPTIVLFVNGGVVQAVEGRAGVRVVLCDFDSPEDALKTVGGRPCVIGIWDPLEAPSPEFDEAVRLADE